MKLAFSIGFICSLLAVQGHAYEELNLKDHPDLARSLFISSYDKVTIHDFEDWKKMGWHREMSSVTLENGLEEIRFQANLSIDGDGDKGLHFTTRCQAVRELNFSYVMQVEGVNIKVANGCDRDGSGAIIEIFMPLSDKANDFLVRKFRENDFVKVKMGSKVIPFSTRGFSASWNRLGDVPL